jgi:zinc/manganese transport system permease protein
MVLKQTPRPSWILRWAGWQPATQQTDSLRYDTNHQSPSQNMWDVMFWPIVACVLLPWLLVYLGLHVVRRGIIFIDIAMAQMASLGICVAVLFHLNLESPTTFAIALGFTLLGAAIFSVTGKRTSQVPQEAVIGIAYVVAAAAAVLLLSRAAEGDEQIKQMLVGNILLVTPLEVWKCFGLFAIVGILHFVLRRNFLLVSFDRDGAYEKGLRVRWWDFLFYAAFGLVVTSFVRIAGVLLVFSYLIVPAVCGINLANSLGRRLLIGWFIALIGGVGGLFLSFWWDLPSGAAIVCTFGALLIVVSLISLLRPKAVR